jgi:hypothetical protein
LLEVGETEPALGHELGDRDLGEDVALLHGVALVEVHRADVARDLSEERRLEISEDAPGEAHRALQVAALRKRYLHVPDGRGRLVS